MLYFAAYEPDAHGVPLEEVAVRRAEDADLPACAALMAEREGEDAATWVDRLRYWTAHGQVLFVAAWAGRVVACARLSWLTPAADGGRNAPDGWYLNGIVVTGAFRRRGLGRALTLARCRWVWEGGGCVHFVVNSGNRASMDLHREIGFREVTRDFALPGVTFTGGEGVLFAADASRQGQHVAQLRMGTAG